LTKEGEAFRNDLRLKGQYRPLTRAQQVIRLIIGCLHLITAILWFGTILYVHLILKPAYAARGLPRSELILGWVSILIMAVTGTLLSVARVPTWEALFHTRFGLLLTAKIILFIIMVSTAAFVSLIIGPKLRKKREITLATHKQNLTVEELFQFYGREGRPAYIAYQGDNYDVSGSKVWSGGIHLKKHPAGGDLTEALKGAPQGEDRVLKMRRVGRLMEQMEAGKPFPMRVFYFLAYQNLVFVFLIVFIVSLWRWG
jgi:predicted heme/steroid binding protein